MTDKTPPDFLSMTWREDGYRGFSAVMPLPDYWPIHNAERDELRAAGITCGTDGHGTWHVYYNPKYDKTDAHQLCPQLETAYAAKIQEARDKVAAAEQADERRREDARRDHEEWLEGNADMIQRTVERARALQYSYRDSVKDKVKLAAALSLPITRRSLTDIHELTVAAEKKIAANNVRYGEKYADAAGGVDWADDVVVRAVETLTGLDDDYAEERNGIGWSAGHSSAGHWCHGALQDERYRTNALKLARVLVASYIDQLSRFMPEINNVDGDVEVADQPTISLELENRIAKFDGSIMWRPRIEGRIEMTAAEFKEYRRRKTG
jgi:hypothetical protein